MLQSTGSQRVRHNLLTEHHCYHQQRLHTKQCQTAIILFTVYLLVVKCRENMISGRFWSLGIFRILAVHTKNFSQILICQTAYTICCNNKHLPNLCGLQQQRFIFYPCSMSAAEAAPFHGHANFMAKERQPWQNNVMFLKILLGGDVPPFCSHYPGHRQSLCGL